MPNMVLRRFPALLWLALAMGAAPAPALAWGAAGHRIGAEIAEANLSGHTRAHIRQILGTETLREASTRADEERANPAPFWQDQAGPYHYVTLAADIPPSRLQSPPEGDAYTALAGFTRTLRDPLAGREEKALALRFLVHIVGDVHMPLHVGRPGDRGGNEVFVRWSGGARNLHWVWDTGLVAHKELSAAEYAERLLARIGPEQTLAWWNADPQAWLAESVALREQIYPATGGPLGEGTRASPALISHWDYVWRWTPAMEERLMQSGIRLAAYLDWVFGDLP